MANTRKAPAPVGNLRQARAEQAAARQGEAQSRQRRPAGKAQPGKAAQPATKKPAPAKSAPAKVEAAKVTYSAVGRGGVTRTQQSTSPLSHAVDVCIAGRKAGHFSKGAVVAFYASEAAAQKACDQINSGEAGKDWSNAKVVKVTTVTEQVSA
jgi:hypothetical protein